MSGTPPRLRTFLRLVGEHELADPTVGVVVEVGQDVLVGVGRHGGHSERPGDRGQRARRSRERSRGDRAAKEALFSLCNNEIPVNCHITPGVPVDVEL